MTSEKKKKFFLKTFWEKKKILSDILFVPSPFKMTFNNAFNLGKWKILLCDKG